jgi:translocation and assembly module TamB
VPSGPAEAPGQSTARRRGPWRWLWRIPLALLLAVVTALGLLVGTETGLRLAFDLAARLVPGGLPVEAVRGRLAGALEVRGLRLQQPALALAVDRIILDWRPAELLSGRLHVVRLALEGVRVTPGEAPAEAPAAEPAEAGPPGLPDVRIPLQVVLDELRVADARLVREGVPALEELRLRARAGGRRVTVEELAVRVPGLRLDAAGTLGVGAGAPSDLTLEWQWQPPDGEALAGRGRLSGPLEDLAIEHAVAGGAEARLEARVAGLPGSPRWDARIDLARVEPARVMAGGPALRVSGRLASQGTPADLGLDGSLRVEEPGLGAHQVDLAGRLAGQFLRLDRLELTRPDSPLRLAVTGEAALKEVPEFRAEARWQALRWPPEGAAQAASPEGTVAAEGSLDGFRFRADARVEAQGAPPTRVELRGTGDPRSARVEDLVLTLLGGRVTGSVDLGWTPEVRWDARLALEGLDPGRQWAEWPGRLGGHLRSQGRVADSGPRARVEAPAIDGQLRGYPFRLEALAELVGQEVTVERLALTSGEAQVRAAGRLGEALALDWSVSAPRLEHLLPGAGGTLSGEGKLTGPVGRPHLRARLAGSDLAFAGQGLASLAADADLDLARDGAIRLDLDAQGIAAGERSLGNLTLRGTGSPADHRVTLELSGGEAGLSAALALAGGLKDDATWSGRLERADLGAGQWGAWQLAGPARLTLGQALEAQPVCWASGPARVCAGGARAPDGAWKGELKVSALPLGLAQPFLPREVELAGALEARASASGSAAGALAADARIGLPGGALTLPMGEGRQRLDLSRAVVEATVGGQGLTASVALPVGDLADLNARLALPGWSPQVADLGRQPVSGRLQARVPDLAWVRGFAPDLGAVAGRVAADLTVAGTAGTPRVTGQAELSDGRVEVPLAGLTLEQLRLGARTQGNNRLVYDGGVRSGEGELILTGQTLLDPTAGFPSDIQLKGADFTAVDTPEYWALLSPDLRLRTEASGARLEGELSVPRARIRPRGLPKGAVAPSNDVVIKGAEPSGGAATLPVAADVRLRLGDQVLFEGSGLRGRFAGELAVWAEPGREPLGNGKLGIVEGVYSGLGTDLDIERGWVNYASSPLDNPGLDLRAVKRARDVVAGVTVTGTAQDPKVEVFSQPPRPQTEVLSYLLFGRPLGGGTSQSDQKQLQNAAALAGGGLLAAEVGRQLGLDEFRVEGTEGGGAALSVGQYITPQLYLQYLSGIRSTLNRLRIRYDLTRRIQLQTETGDQQAVDVFYTFER